MGFTFLRLLLGLCGCEVLVQQEDDWTEGRDTWLSKFLHMYELKDRVCSSWFAPVGSAHDYPFFSKWVFYGELGCNGSCSGPSDEISPIFSLWATFIGLYMANYVVERSTGWALTHPHSLSEYEKVKKQMKPDFLEMVPWYSGTSADLFKTVFDLLVSVTLFVGRFDMRMMQAAMTKVQDETKKGDLLYEHFSGREDLWFDFMADTGDGGNSSYAVARLLAQPSILLKNGDSMRALPRGDILLIGGDLAYPNPSTFTYEKRLFCPFEYALQPPPWYKPEHIAVKKPEMPFGVSELKQYDGPQCFVIPGNHDWFDGLHTFMRYICHKSWLGGWFLPQKKSYFALQLPKGWWIFGLDQALHGDIDVYQFKFFAEITNNKCSITQAVNSHVMDADYQSMENVFIVIIVLQTIVRVRENDSVIVMTHEPSWLLDWYWNDTTGKNVTHLICDYLKGRCKLRMAGDLHHYMRHSFVPSDKPVYVQHLLVNGCGGAFLHPTHVFRNFNKFYGTSYVNKAAYPSYEDSTRVILDVATVMDDECMARSFLVDAEDNIEGQSAMEEYMIVTTMHNERARQLLHGNLERHDSSSGHPSSFFSALWSAFTYMLEHSHVSLSATLILLILAYLFIPTKVSQKRRVTIAVLHVSAHMMAALILMMLLELGIETCIRHQLLATSGYHTLYEWYRSVESEHFPDPTGLRARIEQWTFGLYPACIKYLMSAFDVPEVRNWFITRKSQV
ncbi:hypothetical protein ACLOJK_013949 [Asimina triloba]